MWSFHGFIYRGEAYTPLEPQVILDLLIHLGANREQVDRILVEPLRENEYENVWREMTLARFGHIPDSSEDWPQMAGTWECSGHRHPLGALPLLRNSARDEGCPCDDGPAEGSPFYTGREGAPA